MTVRSTVVTIATLGVLLATAPAAAARGDVSQQDREYLTQAHQNNLFEIVTGNLVDRGGCARVRELGPRFAAHHTALGAELIGVATRTGTTLYSVPDPGQLTRIGDLSTRSGDDFDTAWLRDQVAAHLRGLAEGEVETRSGWSPEVKDLAARTAPVLRHHLEEAVAAAAECNAGERSRQARIAGVRTDVAVG